MYQIGEYICYGHAGICEIEEIRWMDLGGEEKQYYVLKPMSQKGSSVYVPLDNAGLAEKMLPVLSLEEVEEAFREALNAKVEWIRDFRLRSEISKKALSSPNRADVLLLMRNIYQHKKDAIGEGKRIHTTDDYFLKDAEIRVSYEFGFILGKTPGEMLEEIKKRLGF